jgi:hypothetical protein
MFVNLVTLSGEQIVVRCSLILSLGGALIPKSLCESSTSVGRELFRMRVSMYLLRPKLVIRDGETPGQMTLTIMFFGASFEACIFVRCMHAAFDGPSTLY